MDRVVAALDEPASLSSVSLSSFVVFSTRRTKADRRAASSMRDYEAAASFRLSRSSNQRLLDEIDFSILEQRLAALRAHPGWDSIPVDMIATAVCAEGGDTSLHPALTMNTLH